MGHPAGVCSLFWAPKDDKLSGVQGIQSLHDDVSGPVGCPEGKIYSNIHLGDRTGLVP